MSDSLRIEHQSDGVVRVTLNRPEVHNAFDDRLIADLTEALTKLGEQEAVRAVVLSGAGKSFSAGADLNWMRRMADYSDEENLADARRLARLMQTLNELPKPTLARVDGAALGGGVGLVVCCDIAIASDRAGFGTTEVRLGIIPAVIGPYVVAAIGARQARRLMLTGERIPAVEAARIGLVHETVPPDGLDAAIDAVLESLLKCGPKAIAAAKRLVRELTGRPLTAELIDESARRIASLRATAEAREGIAAFLEKRRPAWLA